MGVTISYRGSISDLSRVEDFEDRVLDLALELGGHAHVWRSVADADNSRVVRGVMLELFPGQETTSLLISPEGWLIGLAEIEQAEKGELGEPPWCFVKTQYGPLEGHVAIVELFDSLQKEFFPDLEVSDDANYWSTRDADQLRRSFQAVQQATEAMAKGLRDYGISAEAAEDPEIVAARLERIARQVQQTLARPPEHPPVRFGDDDDQLDLDPSEDE
ncbi:MAG: hypothetical protein OES79_09765, partial [Planctomycetota bacterium]|nr:hypothetical protein [Planctomycetota bacterium]